MPVCLAKIYRINLAVHQRLKRCLERNEMLSLSFKGCYQDRGIHSPCCCLRNGVDLRDLIIDDSLLGGQHLVNH